MRKYLTLLRVNLEDALEYRVEAAIWYLYDLLPPVVMLLLWLAIYEEGQGLAGFSLVEVVTYYLGMVVLRSLLTTHVEWAISYDVRMGYLSRYLTRPVNVWGVWLAGELGWKVVRLLWLAPTLALALALLGPQLAFPPLDGLQLAGLALSLALAFALGFFLKLNLGLAAFWLIEIEGATWLYEAAVFLLSGAMLPLEVLPDPVAALARLLPFQYLYSFPATVLLGRVEGGALLAGLLGQVAWLAAAALLARLAWPAALRQYEAVGG
ncbi:MAG: ABC-2 family transporter protein [Chloroflexi bacterium]|nr:ABC-2 family transporter protein [Chloroflexota bacterium]